MVEMLKLNDPSLLRDACYIDGVWVQADTGRTFAVHNPATAALLAQVPDCASAEAQRAVDAAQRAFVTWRDTTAAERSRVLRRWFELMLAHQEDLAQLMTAEQGKPLAEARGEIAYAASFIEWFAEEAKRAYGEIIPSPAKDRQLAVMREPVGVCAAITPWNFPSAMITRKVAPALAAGCTMVLKPAEQTPLSALALVVLAERAGVPPGVFNVVTGDAPAIGRVLTASPVVRKLSFTGSTAVGQLLMRDSAATLKKLSLELGGNAPFIVFDDADVDAAVAGALAAKYRNAGQTCVCSNRFFIQAGVYEAFTQKLAAAVAQLRVGNGMDEGVVQGPLIDQDALAKVQRLVQDAVQHGARVVCGGAPHALGGTWYQPTVLADVAPGMALMHEEIFGPVAPLLRFDSETEVLRLANETEYGLAAYFYTRDHARVWRVSRQLEYGIVGVNTGLISTEVAPFGGVKYSGVGREGSRHGLDEYLVMKYLALGGL